MIDPLHQFVIKPLIKVNVGGYDLSFTNSSLAVFAVVLGIFALFTLGLREKSIIPNRVQAFVEQTYLLITGLIKDNAGTEGKQYFPFVFSIFFFILFGNLFGMIPYMFTFTSHIIATFTLAMIVFLFVTVLGFVRHGFKFFSLFAPKGLPAFLLPLIVPIELISYLTRPISLAVRLFANMMAGHTMMKVFAGFVAMLGVFSIPPTDIKESVGLIAIIPIAVNVILTGFEIVIAMIQAYVFTILTCVYLNDAIHLH